MRTSLWVVRVAVLLGAGPGVVIAVAMGSYIIADLAVQQWRENTRVCLLTLKDLQDIGIPVDPDIPPNVEHWSSVSVHRSALYSIRQTAISCRDE
jgi:hypothetical protein